ncbi:hypothetical protein L6452_27634 [Arctium lappa]|uniref:Uncharacterized protein n=1 Tax=Arctium lappa TaxID=4217 RepID=A0ACB8ZWJ8_ARCLA|nr:hypothetical protein L6452_27634 [Arctium lappa]
MDIRMDISSDFGSLRRELGVFGYWWENDRKYAICRQRFLFYKNHLHVSIPSSSRVATIPETKFIPYWLLSANYQSLLHVDPKFSLVLPH